MAKKFTRLYIGDTVATSGSKCFKKLTTTAPTTEKTLPIWDGSTLEGTTWEIPSGWSATAGYGQFDIDFNVGTSINYKSIGIGFNGNLMGTTFTPTADKVCIVRTDNLVSNNTTAVDFTITITGGTDATNTALKSWLIKFGKLTSHQMITDLTGTIWNIPSGWSAESGYGEFDITAKREDIVNSMTVTITSARFLIGYEQLIATDDYVSFGADVLGSMSYSPKDNTNSLELQYVDGTDATNTNLIKWLYSYGYIASTIISFTIDGTTYQAEEGMTWDEWCESDYNTDNFYYTVATGWVYTDDGSQAISIGGDCVAFNEEITANGEYTLITPSYDDFE